MFTLTLGISILSWMGELLPQSREPMTLIFILTALAILLSIWFFYIKIDKLTGGSLVDSDHIGSFFRFIIGVSAWILFSYNLFLLFEKVYFLNSETQNIIAGGVVGGALLFVSFYIAMVVAEKRIHHLEFDQERIVL